MYDAWDVDGTGRGRLARKALGISPLCADAYMLLADEATVNDADAIALYRLGMKAGELALGPEFEELNGEFWGSLQTRPYMRARTGLAGALYRTGAVDEALTHWRALLALNPNDNQGVRYTLVLVLLDRGRNDELRDLLGLHEDDGGIAFLHPGVGRLSRRRSGRFRHPDRCTSRQSPCIRDSVGNQPGRTIAARISDDGRC